MHTLILASDSRYKKELLERLRIPFKCIGPNLDENILLGETPLQMSKRLSEQKAMVMTESMDLKGIAIIGADQTAECNGSLVQKPESHQKAVEDLMTYSGNTLNFFTSATLICAEQAYKKTITEICSVKFRKLNRQEIENYLMIEQPYDCAGAFKCEGLGISLFESIKSSDPFALVGLPLIGISQGLRELGYDLYGSY